MKRFYERVKKWNYRMGVTVRDTFGFPSQPDRKLAIDLIIEEAKELRDAKSKEEVLDAFADLQFVHYGAMARHGITFEEFQEYFSRVCKSNDSKFANTEDEALQSVAKEAERLDIDPNLIDYTEVDGKYVIFRTDTKKILKSIKYKSPEEFGSLVD